MCDNVTNEVIIKEEILENSDTNDQIKSDCDYECEQYNEINSNYSDDSDQHIIKSEQSDDHSDYELPKTKRKYKKRKSRYSIDCPQFSKAILAVKHIEEDIDHYEHIKALRSTKDDKLIGYRCKWFECEFTNRYLKRVERHIKAIHTNDRRYKCHICDNCYTDESRLKSHYKDNHSNKFFACDYPNCNYVTTYARRVNYHKNSHTKPFVCDWPECGQHFGTSGTLNEHRKGVHLKEYRFACDWPGCDKVYLNRSARSEHKAVHTGKQYECVWPGCEYISRNPSTFRKHKRNHLCSEEPLKLKKKKIRKTISKPYKVNNGSNSIVKEFVCTWPECGKLFANNWNLEKHLRVHSGERPYKCEYIGCNRSFAESGNMVKHLRTHNKKKNQK